MATEVLLTHVYAQPKQVMEQDTSGRNKEAWFQKMVIIHSTQVIIM